MIDIEKTINELENIREGLITKSLDILQARVELNHAIQTIRELEDRNDEYEEQLEVYKETIDDLNISLTDSIEKIAELQNSAKQEAISELINTSSLFNQGYVCGVRDAEIKAKSKNQRKCASDMIVI